MNYVFSYYRENDFDEIEELILASYKWEYPIWSISRHEFSLSIEPEFAGIKRGWERSTGVYRCKENNKLAACVISEGNALSLIHIWYECTFSAFKMVKAKSITALQASVMIPLFQCFRLKAK